MLTTRLKRGLREEDVDRAGREMEMRSGRGESTNQRNRLHREKP
jgi:hypothetical protein